MNKNRFSPDTHVFLWDLHEVILTKSLWQWLMAFVRFNRKWELVRRLDRRTVRIMITFAAETLKLTKKQMVSEELLIAAQQAHNTALIELVELVCSAYAPIKKTVLLMKELSRLGYKHHLGSNIGQTIFAHSAEKFSDIFTSFEVCSIPFMQDARIIKKPDPHFFMSHAQKAHVKPEHIIFVDDKLANVMAAQSVGMQAIHFKSPKQLKKQLIAWGILS